MSSDTSSLRAKKYSNFLSNAKNYILMKNLDWYVDRSGINYFIRLLHVKNVESCLGLDPCIGNSLFYEFPHISQFTICNSTFPSFVNKSAENSLSDQEQTNGLNTIPTNLSAIVNEEKGNNMDTTLTILSAFADSDDSDLESNKTSSKTASEEGSLKSKVKRHKKRSPSRLRKNPKAPKRFKSSYICFFVSKQREIKDALGEKSTVAEISKRSAEMWKTLSDVEKKYWDDVAEQDKQRFLQEKEMYTGSWHVPWKRAKKDPSAPKRPMSAFLYFSKMKRRILKLENPSLSNIQISRMLGQIWRDFSEEDRRPFIDEESTDRKRYKDAIDKWRKEKVEKEESERKEKEKKNLADMNEIMSPIQYFAPTYDQSQKLPNKTFPQDSQNLSSAATQTQEITYPNPFDPMQYTNCDIQSSLPYQIDQTPPFTSYDKMNLTPHSNLQMPSESSSMPNGLQHPSFNYITSYPGTSPPPLTHLYPPTLPPIPSTLPPYNSQPNAHHTSQPYDSNNNGYNNQSFHGPSSYHNGEY